MTDTTKLTPRSNALALKFSGTANDDLSEGYGQAIDLCRELEEELYNANCYAERLRDSATRSDVAREDKWISTRQYDAPLPKPGEVVMIWYQMRPDGWRVYLGEFMHYNKTWRPMGGNGNFNDEISHWMPLPKAPRDNSPESK